MRRAAGVVMTILGGSGIVGCGSVANSADADPNAPDARIDAPPGTPDAAMPCDPTLPFGAASPVGGANTPADELSLRVSGDELAATVSRSDPTTGATTTIYETTRGSSGSAFAPPVALGGPVNASDADNPTELPGGLTLVFSTVRFGNYDIALATRTSLQADFTTPTMITTIDTPSVELDPYLLHTGDALYLTRVVPGGGVPMLVSRVSTSGAFGAPTVVPGLALAVSPVVSDDEREVFIAQNQQIYRSTRASPTDAFVAPNAVPELAEINSDNRPTALSADGCTIYFASTRAGGAGGWDIWSASRRP